MQQAKQAISASYHASKRHARRIHAHPLGLPVVLFLVLFLVSGILLLVGYSRKDKQLVVRTSDNYIAIVNVEGVKQSVPTNARTVGELLYKMQVHLASGDRVEPAVDAEITNDNYRVNVYRASPVSITDGVTKVVSGSSAAATPRELVAQSGVTLYPEDLVEVAPTDNFVTQRSLGHQVDISRATSVQLSIYGNTPVTLRTHAKTVADLVESSKIKLTKDDTVKPALTTPVTANMQVAVVRNGVQTVTVEEEIPAPVKTIVDTSLSFGSQAVRQEGSAGKQTRTYQVKVENGEEVSRILLQSVVTIQPVERIVAKGNTVNIPADKQAVMAAAGVSPSDYAYVDYIFSRESRWNAAAMNASGCGGLGQACPASKLAASCPNWQSDPVCQTRWFSGYASRYGGWAGAYNAWLSKHWW